MHWIRRAASRADCTAGSKSAKSAEMTAMARSFYADNKRVSIAAAKTLLGFTPAFPSYRESLQALAKAGEGRGG